MPITIKPEVMKYRDPTSGDYKGVDVIAERTTSEQVSAIEAEGASQLQAIQDQADAAMSALPSSETLTDLSNDFAPQYSNLVTYSVGDYCMHDYKLYRCKTVIATPESWTASHWEFVNTIEALIDIKNTFSSTINDTITGVEAITGNRMCVFEPGYVDTGVSVGSTVTLDVVPHSDVVHSIQTVQEGDIYYLCCQGGINSRAYAILTSELVVLAVSGVRTKVEGSITIPLNGAYLVLNSNISVDYYAFANESIKERVQELESSKVLKLADVDALISLGDDLDDYVYPGTYSAQFSTIAQDAIYNCPVSVGFKLVVSKDRVDTPSGKQVRQFLFPYASTSYFIRYHGSTAWGDWLYISTDADVDSKIEEAVADVDSKIEEAVGEFKVYPYNSCDLSDFWGLDLVHKIINNHGDWYISSDYVSTFIPLPLFKNSTVTIVNSGPADLRFSLLNSDISGDENNDPVTTFAQGETGRRSVGPGSSVTVALPSDCKFIFIVLFAAGVKSIPESIILNGDCSSETLSIDSVNVDDPTGRVIGCIDVIQEDETSPLGMKLVRHDAPQNLGIRNITKRADQLRTIQYRTLKKIPVLPTSSDIQPGNYTGVMYSSVVEYDKFVGWEVSLKTFMTAVNNQYSLLYTEDTNGARSTSAYGITYHGSNCGAYFGIVCNIYALYSLGFNIPWSTGEFAYCERVGILKKSPDQTAWGLRVGDLIWQSGHASVILDITRNENGDPEYIYWSESVHNFPRVTRYTLEQAQYQLEHRGSSGCIIYYCPTQYNNTLYVPSEFVAVQGESPQQYTYNNDICTYAGDYACFYNGEPVYINYNQLNPDVASPTYDVLKVYQDDDTEVSSYDLEDPSLHSVMISTVGPGLYKARLIDSDNHYSDYTHFEVVDTTVSCTYFDSKLHVSFSSSNGVPLYAALCYRSGKPRGKILFTDIQRQLGYLEFDPYEVIQEQYGENPTEPVYIKVYFQGQYGVVTNPYLNTNIYS